MSLKLVEMQIAVPRTSEISRIQNEQQQRPSQDQTHLAGEQVKQDRQAAQRSVEVSETSDAAVRDGGRDSGAQHEQENETKQETPEKQAAAPHPYKGKLLDITL